MAIRVSSSHGFVLVRGWNIQEISHARSPVVSRSLPFEA